MHLSTLLNSQLSNSVGDLDAKLVSALDDELSGLGRNVVGDLSAVLSVIMEKIGIRHHLHLNITEKATNLLCIRSISSSLGL